jgi:hypothetical protein
MEGLLAGAVHSRAWIPAIISNQVAMGVVDDHALVDSTGVWALEVYLL